MRANRPAANASRYDLSSWACTPPDDVGTQALHERDMLHALDGVPIQHQAEGSAVDAVERFQR